MTYTWDAGCEFGGVILATEFRIESDYVGTRMGNLEPQVPGDETIDEEGNPIEAERPPENAETL